MFKCHSFKSATVVPVQDEPLTVCAEGEWVFVVTRQCTIRVFKQTDQTEEGYIEWRAISTISVVDKLFYNKLSEFGFITLICTELIFWRDFCDNIEVEVDV